MTNFADIEVGNLVHLKFEYNGRILIEGDGVVIEKAPNDLGWNDLKITGRSTSGDFSGWFPLEAVTVKESPKSTSDIVVNAIVDVLKQNKVI